MVDGQLIADSIRRLAEQSVVIERANEVLHDVTFAFSQAGKPHLLLQLVVEGNGVAQNVFLALFADAAATLVNGQFLVVAPDAFQCRIKSRLPILTLTLAVEVVVLVRRIQSLRWFGAFQIVGPVGIGFQRRIVVHFRIDTL